jgi:plasmid stabilization system protein ParE
MGYPYRLHEQAHKEYIAAYAWYEEKQKGLGSRFMTSVEKRLQQISNHPEFYSKKQNTDFREVKVENFPYMIVYEFFKRKQLIYVAAIYHSKRNPNRKYRKLK